MYVLKEQSGMSRSKTEGKPLVLVTGSTGKTGAERPSAAMRKP